MKQENASINKQVDVAAKLQTHVWKTVLPFPVVEKL
jgi:hypothetical protein